jgi:4-hydroxyphenylpyruvate dioxygenase
VSTALLGIDHVELYVGDAAQAAYLHTRALGFRHVAYSGLETGARDAASHVLEQGAIRLVLTGALDADHPAARHVARHGGGVKVVALAVPDVAGAYAAALAGGAPSVREPHVLADEHGEVELATVAAYGPVLHTFVDRSRYAGPFLPGYGPREDEAGRADCGLTGIDHVVGNVELGGMERWVRYYERVLGMTEMLHLTDEDVSTEYSALMSKVVADGSGRVKFPINEPAAGLRRSQVEEFLEFHDGPGVQHLALSTDDIVSTVRALRERGVGVLNPPAAYYEDLPQRVGTAAGDVGALRELGVLVDRDDEGELLQAFSHPIGDRPTLFYEIIERRGARGFGAGSFRALFAALEREQARRGNL